MQRLFRLFFVLIWLAGMLVPLGAGVLLVRKEIAVGQTRLFLVQGREATGIGLQRARELVVYDNGASVGCRLTTVRYWLLQGSAEPGAGCLCADGVARTAVAPSGFTGGQCTLPP
jgi:hypothetical protein